LSRWSMWEIAFGCLSGGNAKDLRRVQPDLACRGDDLYGSSAPDGGFPL
jgi:hypothetical protein